MNKNQQRRLLYALTEMTNWQAFLHLIDLHAKDHFGFLRGWLLPNRRSFDVHMIRERRQKPPRMIYLLSYVGILYTVTTTVILIATKNMALAVFSFAVFVVPLFLIISLAKKRKIFSYG